jgi:hypothetical protein
MTLALCAPEQVRGDNAEIGVGSDIYAWACCCTS